MSSLKRRGRTRSKTRRTKLALVVALGLLCFSLVGAFSAGLIRSNKIKESNLSEVTSPDPPPPPPLPSPSLAKEYIYAGSRLIATEEPVNAVPTVSITSPANNAVFTAPANITINATASDSDGTISKVEFYQGNTLLNTDTVAPYSYTWPNVAAGTYSLTAKATDNNNAVISSSSITVISNAAPVVSITSPTSNAIFAPHANITINATASDADGTVTSVEFFQGSTLIGTDTSAPFTVVWNNVDFGSYLLTARATDNRGATTTSSLVAVTTPTFFDDFNDNSLDLGKWHIRDPASPALVSEQSQQLRITLPASTATYNGVGSNATYDMRGGTAQVELVQSVSQAGWVENFMVLELDGQNYLMIQTGVGNCVLRSAVNGVNDQLIIPYDAVALHYWRIRHNLTTNTISFETSADGAVWTSRKTVTAGFALTALRFALVAGAYGTGNAAPGAAIYNDFQFIPNPGIQGTPPPILSDDFNDNSLDPAKWDANNLFSGFTSSGVPVNETNQRLEIGPLLANTAGSNYRGIRSVNTYNFTNGYSYVDLIQAPSSTSSADAMFTIGSDVNNFYRLYVNAGSLIGLRKINGTKTTLFTIPYDTVNHRFLRIRHDGPTGNVTFDTAPNNGGAPGAWVQRYSEAWNAAVALSAIIFEVKGGTSAETNAPGMVIFDNFAFGLNSSPPGSAPTVSGISPTSGPIAGGASVTISGTGFAAGATVTLGGSSATNVNVSSSTSITATMPAHAAGLVNVVVTNTDAQSGTLVNGYTYTSAPTVTGVSPTSGSTSGGTSVTISGTGFSAGAAVTFAGSAATNVNVSSSTSITATTSAHSAGVVNVVVTNPDTQSGTLPNGYTYTSPETVLLADDFNDNSLDPAKWDANNLFSGFTSSGVPVNETNQRLEIGPLLANTAGSNYRGIRSVNTYNFTNGYSYVDLIQAPSSTSSADAMFTIGSDVNNFYRLYVNGGNLIGLRKIDGTKTTLFTIPYDSVSHRFLRIRNVSGAVTLDTAPNNGGVPGTWVQRYSEIWSASVSVTAIIFEVKGGTSAETSAPGTVIFDNFRAAVP